MEYQKISEEEAIKAKNKVNRVNWKEIVSEVVPGHAVRIPCKDGIMLRSYQIRIYEAARKVMTEVETFKTVEDGKIYLNIVVKHTR